MKFHRLLPVRPRSAMLLCLMLGMGTFTDAEEARSLTRDQAVLLAFRNNRLLRIAELEIRRAFTRLEWSGRMENPELEISTSGDGFGQDEGEENFEVAFSQRFPVTAKLKREKSLRRQQVILAEAEVAERRRTLAGEVDLAVVELLATRELIRLTSQLVDLNREISDFLDEQAKRGEASRLDVNQAVLEGRTLEQNRKVLEAAETQQRLELNRIIGLDPDTSIHLEESLGLPGERPAIEVSFRDVLCRRPDYVLALAKIDEADASLSLEQAKRWEDIAVRVFVEGEDAVDEPNGLEENTFTGFGISIPLPLRNRNQEGIAQAEIDRDEADLSAEAVRFRIRSECAEAFRERADAWEIAREAKGEFLSLAEENLAEFRKAYQQGQAGLMQVQRAQEQLLELRTSATDYVAHFHRAGAKVRLATGSYPGLSVPAASAK